MKKITLQLFALFLILILKASSNTEIVNQEIYKTNQIFKLYYNQRFEECKNYCYNIISQDIDNSSAYVFYFASSYQLEKLQETINDTDNKYIKFIQDFNISKKNEIIETQKEYQLLTILSGYSNIFLYFTSKEGSSYLDEAINTLRKSLFFPVSFSSIYTGLGISYFEKKLNERAISMINKALNIKSYDAIALEYYGKIQNRLGNYSQTISKLKNYTIIEYPDLLYQLGFAYEKNNETDKALETYMLAYKHDPYLLGQGFISLVRIGDIYLYVKNDKEKAISYYQEILRILPDSLVAKTKIEEAQNYNPSKKEQNKKK
ncbi:MAG: tetratricopeptide repeat protein [Candidatus Calescibacterium sp.]|nr:tetratricopeptide repeat protein [Candidatus Calescibacterium sp.]